MISDQLGTMQKLYVVFSLSLIGIFQLQGVSAHPHQPPPREVPQTGLIGTLEQAEALAQDVKVVQIDGAVRPAEAQQMLSEVAKRPIEELHIHHADKWTADDLSPLAEMPQLTHFSLSEDTNRGKAGYWTHIAKATNLKKLYIHLSGD